MSQRKSEGPLVIRSNEPVEINSILSRIQDRLDTLEGLRGPVAFKDRISVSPPKDPNDALTLARGRAPDPLTAPWTWQQQPIRIVDNNGTLIHAFGTAV